MKTNDKITTRLNQLAGVSKPEGSNEIKAFKRTVINIDGVSKTFTKPESYKKYVGVVWAENELNYPNVEEPQIAKPVTLHECDSYVTEYCSNLTITIKQ